MTEAEKHIETLMEIAEGREAAAHAEQMVMDGLEMVERVAKAIFYAEWADAPGTAGGDVWEGMQRSSKRKYLAMARAAIEAMMEPTEAMRTSGEVFVNHGRYGADEVWNAMLSEALSPSLKEQERTP